MIGSTARLLHVLALLDSRPAWTCQELSRRLGVTDRTVRRDIARLRELGYGIDSDPGPWGGYRLARRPRVPALALDEEEGFAVAVALRETAAGGVLGNSVSALSALFKLQTLLPERFARHLDAVNRTLAHTADGADASPQADASLLWALATACRQSERLALTYRDHHQHITRRYVDPYRLVRANRRWYFLAEDVDKQQWRTFRVDRVLDTELTGHRIQHDNPPDPATLVTEAIAAVTYPLYATIRLSVPLQQALQIVPATIGTHRPDSPDATLIDIGANDIDCLVTYLMGLGTTLRVLSPDTVRQALLDRVSALRVDNL
ncbi:WYL domain-containing protein [Nocardia sp. NPDC050710]|uniref:helix-turn-helix transcriptional regulator n=1 Tax=Nocardia sp. NPDC050710 TaxID=3157220 RepID=UPI0033C9BAC9